MSSEICAGSSSSLLFLAASRSWLPLGIVRNILKVENKKNLQKILNPFFRAICAVAVPLFC